jgi:hypothetical protein
MRLAEQIFSQTDAKINPLALEFKRTGMNIVSIARYKGARAQRNATVEPDNVLCTGLQCGLM